MDRRDLIWASGGVVSGGILFGTIGGFAGFYQGQVNTPKRIEELQAEHRDELAEIRDRNTFYDRQISVSRQFTLNPGEYEAFEIEGPDDEPRELLYIVTSDFDIDVMIMSVEEFEKFESDEDSSAAKFASSPDTTHATGRTRFNQPLVLLIDYTSSWEANPNPNPVDIDATYEVYE